MTMTCKKERMEEEYWMLRSRQHSVKGDHTGSRSWMLTAKLLHPKSYEIQFEAYLFEKSQRRVKEAAKLLAGLLNTFVLSDCDDEGDSKKKLLSDFERGQQKTLWAEVDAIADVLREGGGGGNEKGGGAFLESIVHSLPRDVCSSMLMKAAARRINVLQKVELFLVAFKRFPELLDSVQTNDGVECLHLILSVLKELESDAAAAFDEEKLNLRRELLRMFVDQVLPLLLPAANVKMEQDVIDKILGLMVTQALDKIAAEDFSLNWDAILNNLERVGNRLDDEVWHSLTFDLARADRSGPEVIWHRILQVQQQQHPAVFYVSAFMFLKYLYEYNELSMPPPPPPPPPPKRKPSGNDDLAVAGGGFFVALVEGFANHQDHSSSSLRRRTTEEDRRVPFVSHASHSGGSSTPLIMSFLKAVKYFELLRTPHLETRWKQQVLIVHRGGRWWERSRPFTMFCADFFLFHAQYREALQTLRRLSDDVDVPGGGDLDNYRKCCWHVKLASIHFCLGEHLAILDQIVQAAVCFNGRAAEEQQQLSPYDQVLEERRCLKEIKQATMRSRHLHFLALTRQTVISYGCKLLVHVLKDKSLQPTLTDNSDTAMGHVLVMLQYCYPEERDLLVLLLHRIRLKDTFCYPIFCNYVVRIEFLEEFANLAASESINLILDPASSAITAQRRVGTRGANRGEKVEVRSMLRKQVSRSFENLDVVITDFLIAHRDSIFQCLM